MKNKPFSIARNRWTTAGSSTPKRILWTRGNAVPSASRRKILPEPLTSGPNPAGKWWCGQGGARPGAGRTTKNHVRLQLLVPPATRAKIEKIAARDHISLSEAVSRAVAKA